jgi:hypothetical protein
MERGKNKQGRTEKMKKQREEGEEERRKEGK